MTESRPRRRARARPGPFTPGELEVMQVLWRHGPLKPGEIQRRFPRPIRNAALRSVLLVLLEKGHVTRDKEGRAYRYEARTAAQRQREPGDQQREGNESANMGFHAVHREQ